MADEAGRRRSRLGALALSALLGAATGCLERRDDAGATNPSRCTSCHGSDANSGDEVVRSAPPVDLFGNTTPEFPGVGAHAQHLYASETHGAIACTECHRVPDDTRDPGHVDSARPAELEFGALASSSPSPPSYDADARRCSNTYCHADGDAVWTAPRSSSDACGLSCHALPPAGTHPDNAACSTCHAGIREDRSFVDPSEHVDGRVQVKGPECSACHGSGDSGAPPPDLQGNDGIAARGVGAHTTHLAGTDASRPVDCAACHRVPDAVDDPGHLDDPLAELVFSGAAVSSARSPGYDADRLTCSATWCHGPSDAASTSPAWTDAAALDCTGCHEMPPREPHPPFANCALCHRDVAGADGTIADRERHVDGVVDVADLDSLGCGDCHGDPPPTDVDGRSDTASLGVGAHAVHVSGSERARAVTCGECHLVPETVLAPGHLDTALPAEVVFSGPARSFDAEPVYAAGSCESSWCHGDSWVGARESGGSNTTPTWNVVDGTQAECGSCHALPPPAPHPQDADDCSRCHETLDAERRFLFPETHVDGDVTFTPP